VSKVDELDRYQGNGAADRVRAFLNTRNESRGLDKELIISYGKNGVIYELRQSDLRELLLQAEGV
jgi:hypothetical protein